MKLFLVVLVSVYAAFLCTNGAASPYPSSSPVTPSDLRNDSPRFKQEIDCSIAGGICIEKQGCPSDKISTIGACPKQSNLGAVCCQSLSEKENRCKILGGECKSTCPEVMIISRAVDCAKEMKCCPLVS